METERDSIDIQEKANNVEKIWRMVRRGRPGQTLLEKTRQQPIATETRRAKTNKKIPKLACRPAQGNSLKPEMELDLHSQSSESLKAILKEIEGERGRLEGTLFPVKRKSTISFSKEPWLFKIY